MKNLHVLLCAFLLASGTMLSQASVFVLEPSQSMSISGKGPGQDAAINKYADNDCIATVKNMGKNSFEVRIQKEGKVIKTITIGQGETKDVSLLRGNVFYFDSTL
jgi:hypothetical protein